MSEHDVYSRCVRQVTDLSSEIARLRAGLLTMQHEAATQTMTDANPNAARALAARFEQRCKALLGTADYEPPAVVYEGKLEVRAGSPLAILPQSTQVPDLIRPWGDVP